MKIYILFLIFFFIICNTFAYSSFHNNTTRSVCFIFDVDLFFPSNLFYSETPLHLLSTNENTKIFISRDVDSKGCNKDYTSLLHKAAESNDIKSIEYLISKGVDVNAKDSHGMTPLHTAVDHIKKEAVDVLLNNGADANAMNERGKTPLSIAVEVHEHELEEFFPRQSKKDIIKALFAHGAKPGNITEAIAAGDLDTIKLLITSNRNLLNGSGQNEIETPLWSAAYWNCKEAAEFFISMGADVNRKYNNQTPMDVSSSRGSTAITELLISKGADVNSVRGVGTNTPLFNVVCYGKDQIVYPSFVKIGNKIKRGREFIHMKFGNSEEDYIKTARLLIDNGANVNVKCLFHWSPLHIAVAKNWKEMTELLISAGADVNSRDDELQSTPLHFAAEDGYQDIAELLISKGADINSKNKDGKTPLKLALENGWNAVVDLLRKHGAKE